LLASPTCHEVLAVTQAVVVLPTATAGRQATAKNEDKLGKTHLVG
jgi:hypothetical protein